MTNARPSEIGSKLRERLESAGRRLGTRESAQREAVAEAQQRAEALHAATAFALAGFHEAASDAGAPHLEVELSPLRVDDKHLRSIEFELRRGRYVAIVTVKSRGEVTLVGLSGRQDRRSLHDLSVRRRGRARRRSRRLPREVRRGSGHPVSGN
jgi:hypothetical protein